FSEREQLSGKELAELKRIVREIEDDQ
ncbi:MAG: hypothetical protein JWM33_1706, partial [Caulobacteraceae bacterium]|nr:hypothetical protein [Caulobacteraceae bacterium]